MGHHCPMPQKRKKTGKPNPGKFKKGKSGNPGGRPKDTDEVRAAKAYIRGTLTMKAARKLEDLLECGNPAVERQAADSILDRSVGKPSQSVELSTPDGPLSFDVRGMSEEALRKLAGEE